MKNINKQELQLKFSDYPIKGFYGEFGGYYVPEILFPALEELSATFEKCRTDQGFLNELKEYNSTYGGRPSPPVLCKKLIENWKWGQDFSQARGSNSFRCSQVQ